MATKNPDDELDFTAFDDPSEVDEFEDVLDIDHSSIGTQFGQALIADAAIAESGQFESLDFGDIEFDVSDDDDDFELGDGSSAPPTPLKKAAPLKPFILKEGDLIGGRFVMNNILDRGSLGEIWQVHDTKLQRDIALKIIKLSRILSADERNEQRAEIDERVRREILAAQHSSTICHHIVQIYDFGSLPNDDPFIVMEYLDGQNLHDWMSVHLPTDWTVVRDIAIQITAALKALHHNSFIHRDIKPTNIFTIEGDDPHVPSIKLIDFGSVKDIEGASITRTPSSIGTDRYMAPEMATLGEDSDPITNRCDIFSLGVVLFEMLTGHNPLSSNRTQRYAAYSKGLESCGDLAPADTPTWLTQLIDDCLAIQPYIRPSAHDLHAALKSGQANTAAQVAAFEIALDEPRLLHIEQASNEPQHVSAPQPVVPSPTPAQSQPAPIEISAPTQEASSPAIASKPFNDERPERRYGTPPQAQRSSWPIALAIFAGMVVIAGAWIYTREPQPTQAPAPVITPSSEPELTFKPRGPVDQDDFPKRPRLQAPITAAPATQAAKVPAPLSDAPVSDAPKAAPVTRIAKPARRPARRLAKASPKRPSRVRPRKGLAKSFAEVASDARAGGPAAAGLPPAVPAAGISTVITRFNDSAGPQFIDETEADDGPGEVHLPYNTRLPAKLSAGISSAAHGTVLATLSADVKVGGKTVLRKGDVVRGRSSNTSDRIKVRFSEIQRGSKMIKFVGAAYSAADNFPGLKAKKKMIPTEERGSNAVVRGALTTATTVAGQVSGGVAGDLAGNVAREGAADARPDFQPRQPFVLTVPKATRFTILVTGK